MCYRDDQIICVLLRDPVTGNEFWVPPDRGFDPGESPAEAARREVWEETHFFLAKVSEKKLKARPRFIRDLRNGVNGTSK